MSALYLFALARGALTGAMIPSTFIESFVLGTTLAGLAVIMLVPRFRDSAATSFNILSVDILLLPAIGLAYLLTGDPSFLQLAPGIFLAWPAAFMVVFPAYAIFRVTKGMMGGARLSFVIPAVTGLFILLTSLDLGFARSQAGMGLSNLVKVALASASGAGPQIPLETTVTGVVACAAIMLFALRRSPGVPSRIDSVLATASVATLGTIGWGVALSTVTTSAQLVFGVPALVLVGLIWWAYHAN
jgi:hypothetical protein